MMSFLKDSLREWNKVPEVTENSFMQSSSAQRKQRWRML
jgi:hypothetical protein